MRTSQNGIDLIKHFESLHDGDLTKIGLQPKMCPAGIWTAGYGHALTDINGSFLNGVDGYQRLLEIYPDLETITEDEAEDLLKEDLEKFETKINSLKLSLLQNEFDALVSFTFNCGFSNLLSSTLLKRVKSRSGDIKEAFLMWNKSNGKVLNGLIKRREAEAELFINNKLNI